MRESSSFANFCQAFTAEWFTSMGGGISVPLAIAAVYVDNPPLKIGLGLTAIVCFVFASFRIWKVEREARIAAEYKVNKRETRKDIRIALGGFHQDGQVLKSRCGKKINDDPPPIADVAIWVEKTESYIREWLDESWIIRFGDDSNLQSVTPFPPPPRDYYRQNTS